MRVGGCVLLRRDGARPLRIVARMALRRQVALPEAGAMRLGLFALTAGGVAHEVAIEPPSSWRIWPHHAAGVAGEMAGAVAALGLPLPWLGPPAGGAGGLRIRLVRREAAHLALMETFRAQLGSFLLELAEAGWPEEIGAARGPQG